MAGKSIFEELQKTDNLLNRRFVEIIDPSEKLDKNRPHQYLQEDLNNYIDKRSYAIHQSAYSRRQCYVSFRYLASKYNIKASPAANNRVLRHISQLSPKGRIRFMVAATIISNYVGEQLSRSITDIHRANGTQYVEFNHIKQAILDMDSLYIYFCVENP
ncbi:hypothetical protein [Glycocaulis alkaliphilus]|uniref:hypothetical protein n=1 Tax=Glycocaulis alkaliphilus TaxID=1434191 RepID=UPI000FDA3DAD|nr:hypothetical protein [Glycocaulis alkaliphilus]GGB67334.1 hypothetical protein GCM10007417_03870 [Glycocaulis alkaliphilus]